MPAGVMDELKLEYQLIHDTSRQQHRPKHVELTRNNKLTLKTLN